MNALKIVEKVYQESKFPFTDQVVSTEVISDRRGAILAKVNTSNGIYALKISINEGHALRNEVKAYHNLSFLKKIYIASNLDTDFPWILLNWVEGKSSNKVAEPLRESKDEREMARLFLAMAETLKSTHTEGFLHGDLQPLHFVHSNNSMILIDWGISHFKDDTDYFYKGAFVHFASPEVAEQMLDKKERVKFDVISEVYSLCSVLYFIATNNTSTYYGTKDYKCISFEEKLKRVSVNTPNKLNIPEFSNIEKILLKGLNLNRSDRYQSTDELILDLESI